jgi:glycosyltransferase involved in cell wall biosynthesis
MKVAMLSPIAWRTPPRHYGPWENVVSLLTEALVARGVEVTLFATGDSQTTATLSSVCPMGYEEDRAINAKVWECLHIAEVFERGDEFDIIHSHFDFLPLSYSRMTKTPLVTTIHGFSSPGILPVYRKYNVNTHYVSISESDRSPELDYAATVYHGIDLDRFTFQEEPGEYLLFFGRIHPDKGTKECIEVARNTGKKLVLAGIIQDTDYFEREVQPHLNDDRCVFVGSVGPGRRDQLMGGALALLHPIGFDEPFGLSVVESMACGTPVLAINRGSMPEVIDHGVTGFLVKDALEMADAVYHLDGLERARCRQWVEERFSVDRMARDYEQVYRRIVEGRGR